MRVTRQIFGYGHLAVAIFIVLSGYSLMLPLARFGRYELLGGFRPYIRRRARRLLPPYYAALVLSILSIVVYNSVSSAGSGEAPGPYDAARSTGSLISHVFLVHNWSFDWAFRINGPMWSVATEWQVYFLMPLVLLPLWKRYGGTSALVATWGVTLGDFFVIPDNENLYWAAPWFIGSFAFGMWGAVAIFSEVDQARRFSSLSWGWIACGFGATIAGIIATGKGDMSLPILDPVVSLFALSLICHASQRVVRGERDAAAVRALSSRPAAYLGGFSYSLYLIQHPLLRLLEKVLGDTSLSYEQILIVAVLVGLPCIVFAAWIFSLVFERPFTTGDVIMPFLRRQLGNSRRDRSDHTATLLAIEGSDARTAEGRADKRRSARRG